MTSSRSALGVEPHCPSRFARAEHCMSTGAHPSLCRRSSRLIARFAFVGLKADPKASLLLSKVGWGYELRATWAVHRTRLPLYLQFSAESSR